MCHGRGSYRHLLHRHLKTSHEIRRKTPRRHHTSRRLPIDAKVTLATATKHVKRRKLYVFCRKYEKKGHPVSKACSSTQLNTTGARHRRPRWKLAIASEQRVVSSCFESSCSCFTCWHLLFWSCEPFLPAGRKLRQDAGLGSRLGSPSEACGDGGEVFL